MNSKVLLGVALALSLLAVPSASYADKNNKGGGHAAQRGGGGHGGGHARSQGNRGSGISS